jgi:hypothetical protein
MPSVTDVSSNNNGKSTPPPTTTTAIDTTSTDPIIQAVLALEKKQRNLGKRKVIFLFIKIFLKQIFFSFRRNWRVMIKKQKVVKN